jgi:hypothetical protein
VPGQIKENIMRISSGAAVRNTIRHRAIYDGRDLLGTLEQVERGKFIARNRQRGDEYVAHDRRGLVIGRFNTAIEAANAVGKTPAKAVS